MTDRQTNKQTNIPTSGNDNKAHSLRDVTQQTEWNDNKAHSLRDVTPQQLCRLNASV